MVEEGAECLAPGEGREVDTDQGIRSTPLTIIHPLGRGGGEPPGEEGVSPYWGRRWGPGPAILPLSSLILAG